MENNVKEMILKYKLMKIGENVLACPYYMNVAKRSVIKMLREIPISESKLDKFSTLWKEGYTDFGRFQGKGTPEQIINAAIEITNKIGLPIQKTTTSGVAIEIMRHIGLGIDCSGLVFNLLKYAFDKEGKTNEFLDSLDWSEPDKRDASRAGVFVFAGKASQVVMPDQLKAFDLLLIKNSDGKYLHMALLTTSDDGDFEVVQSTLVTVPTGINISKLKIIAGKPEFGYRPGLGKNWNELYEKGNLEFRRLKIFQ